MDWKFEIGNVIPTGGKNRIVVTGRREDQCQGGVQRFYLAHHVLESFTQGIGTTAAVVIPDIVLEEIDKMAKEKKQFPLKEMVF